MAIKRHDFVEVEYTGRLKDSGEIFDTTDKDKAKEANIFAEDGEYRPVVICIGEGFILKGIDDFLEGRELGEFRLDLPPERAFGRKNAKLIQMVPASKFREQKIQPAPGLRLNMDGHIGLVRSVTGGRVIVDFNHPLAGKDLVYDVKVNRVVTDKKEQVQALLRSLLALRDADVEIKDNKAVIRMPELPARILDELKKKIKELVKVEVEFATVKKE